MGDISISQAKAYARLIYEQIPKYIETHRTEYIEFLKSRQAVSKEAKKELEHFLLQKAKAVRYEQYKSAT